MSERKSELNIHYKICTGCKVLNHFHIWEKKQNLVLIYVCDGIPRYATDRSEILWKSGEVLFPKDKISAKYPDHHPTR